MKKKKPINHSIPLIVEQHPLDYKGYPFITLIQYRKQHILTVVDNTTDKTIRAIVLDLCGPENVNENEVINVAARWYEHNRNNYPVSFEFSKLGMGHQIEKILKSYNIEFVTRTIGPLPYFPVNQVKSVKKRKRRSIPTNLKLV